MTDDKYDDHAFVFGNKDKKKMGSVTDDPVAVAAIENIIEQTAKMAPHHRITVLTSALGMELDLCFGHDSDAYLFQLAKIFSNLQDNAEKKIGVRVAPI